MRRKETSRGLALGGRSGLAALQGVGLSTGTGTALGSTTAGVVCRVRTNSRLTGSVPGSDFRRALDEESKACLKKGRDATGEQAADIRCDQERSRCRLKIWGSSFVRIQAGSFPAACVTLVVLWFKVDDTLLSCGSEIAETSEFLI